MFSTAWKTWSGRIMSRTVAPQAAEASSRPALRSCGFWFPTCVLECGHASFPGLAGVGWPASSLMTAGGPQAESAYTAAAAGRESGASAACVAEHYGKRLGRVFFFFLGLRRVDGPSRSSSILQPHWSSMRPQFVL